MQNQSETTEYFLGAGSPYGFYSYFDNWLDFNELKCLYIIKGGPGTGKSTMMKKIAERALEAGHAVEHVYCASDVESLDGLYFPELKVAFVDGTAPHVIDPLYPGAVDKIINLGDFWNEEGIRVHKTEIIQINSQLKELSQKATRYLLAASSLLTDMQSAGMEGLNLDKLSKTAQRLYFKLKKDSAVKSLTKRAVEKKRFFSAIAAKGVNTKFDEITKGCKRIYSVEDDFQLSPMLLNKIKSYALADGFDIITGYCPCNPAAKLEHLIIPALSTCFITSNHFHPYSSEPYRKINLRRFVSPEIIKKYRFRLRFDRKAVAHMLDGVTQTLTTYSRLHDRLEQFYEPNMDFKKIDLLIDEICEKCF